MLLKTFEYLKPNGLNDVLQVLEELKHNNTHILAGGTDLIPWLRAKVKQADCLVDLAAAGLDQVIFEKDEARIGAMVSFATLCRHPQVVQRLPALAEAAAQVGAVQTRTLATLGGNLCSAVPSLDGAPPLLALAARFRLQAKGGERVVPAEKFFLGPRRTVLQAGEILTEILVPLRKGFKVSFLRMGRRKALTLSIVNVAAGVAIDEDGGIECARISLGAVAPTPIRAVRAEHVLQGQTITAELLAEAAAVAAAEISPISDLRASGDYRRKLSEVLVRRALENALAQTSRSKLDPHGEAGK
jgi:CO/xanthine dehydrogenase FAD-binding subunit